VTCLGDSGHTVLYTTHYMETAEQLCDRIGILNRGRLVATGTRAELREDLGFAEVIELSGSTAGIDLTPMRAHWASSIASSAMRRGSACL
jgi:ABC-type multidrug transport system ATPase subunit